MKSQCSALVLAAEITALVGIAVLIWIGYPYFSTAIDYTQGLRQTVNSLLDKLKGGFGILFGWVKSAVEMVLGWMDPIAAATQTSPLLWKINFITLLLWGGLVIGTDAEGYVDGFFSGEYGAYGEHVYDVFSVLAWPEREAAKWAGSVWAPLGWVVEFVLAPFELGAFVFSLPIALVLYPLLELINGLRTDIRRIETEYPGAVTAIVDWGKDHKKTSGDHNDAVPSAVPERVCSGC